MEGLCKAFFKDSRGDWHQPGNRDEFSPQEAEELEQAGRIKIIRTAMVEGPTDTRDVPDVQRKRGRRKNENTS